MRSHTEPSTFWYSAGLLGLLVAGCVNWHEQPSAARLPQTQMSKDSVGLEIATVSLPADPQEARAAWDSLIRCMDEQILPPEARRQLAKAGIRCGSLGNNLPGCINLALEEAAKARTHPTAERVEAGLEQQRFLQSRSGRRHFVPMLQSISKLTPPSEVMTSGEVETSGESIDQPQCQFALYTSPAPASRANVTVVPEVEYGPMRQRIAAESGNLRFESGRSREQFDWLGMTFDLHSGETVAITGQFNDEFVEALAKSLSRRQHQNRLQRQASTFVRPEPVKLDDLIIAEASGDDPNADPNQNVNAEPWFEPDDVAAALSSEATESTATTDFDANLATSEQVESERAESELAAPSSDEQPIATLFEQASLAEHFFINPLSGRQKVLLIRLVQTHIPDLYTGETDSPLTTTED